MKAHTLFRNNILCLIALLFVSVAHAEQEYTAFDFYIGDDFKGLVPTYYTDETIRIENPLDAIKISGLDASQAELIELLRGEFPFTKEKDNVGKLIADPKTFRIVLLPDPRFLKIKGREGKGVLSNTSDKSAIRSDLQFLHFQTQDSQQIGQYRILNDFSAGKAWVNSDLEFIDSGPYKNKVNDASLNYIFGRWQSSAGYLQSIGRQLTPSAKIAGVTLRTEPLLLSGSDQLRGSNMVLYVPTRARVEFFRNGVLIDTQVLSSGYQEVDTARFPQGSYYVDIIIRGLAGTSRERKFFAKSGFLTTRGAPQFRLDLGELRSNESVLDIPYYQGSAEFRVNNFAQLNLSSFGTDSKQSYVAGFNAVYGNFLVTGAASRASNRKTGLAFGGGGQLFGLNFSGDYEKSEQVSIDELERIEFDQTRNSVETPFLQERLGSEGRRYTATVSKFFDNLELRYNYSYISADPDPAAPDAISDYVTHGPTIRYRVVQSDADTVFLELSSLKTDDVDNHFALLSWQHRFIPWTTDSSIGFRNKNGKTDPVARGVVQYDTIQPRSGQGVRARGDFIAQKQDNAKMESGSFDIRAGSTYGGLTALGNGTNSDSSSQSSWAVGGNLSIAKGSGGGLATGPAGLGQSLLVVDLDNEDDEAITDILVDGQSINQIKGSGRYILGISPYQKVNVRIRPSEISPLTRYDVKSRDVLLYPGSVQTEKFKIEKVFLAIGNIVDENNTPLAMKRISGLQDYPLTEEGGYFQAEVTGGERIEIDIDNNKKCSVQLPKVENKQYYHDFGALICR